MKSLHSIRLGTAILLLTAACSNGLLDRGARGERTDAAPLQQTREPAARDAREEDGAPRVSSSPCGAMTRAACMASRACVLELVPRADGERGGQYECRAAASSCEADLAQSELTRGSSRAEAEVSMKACTDRPGCTLRKSECYCACRGYGRAGIEDGAEAEECDCYCAGGAPVACVSSSASGA